MQTPVDIRPGLVSSALRRRWRIVATVAVIGVVAAFVAALVQPAAYTSTAAVFLNPLEGNPYSPTTSTVRNDQLASLETEAALVSTDVIADAAAETARLPSPPAAGVSVTVPSNSQVLRISYRAPNRAQALAGAQAFADAYLAHREAQAQASIEEQAERLNSQITATTSDLDAATARLGAAQKESAAELLSQQQVQVYASQLAQLRVELSRVASSATNPGEVITPATLPASPDGLPPLVLLLGGLAAGVLLGLVVAVAREHSDDRVRDSDDVESLGVGHVVGVLGGSTGAHNLQAADESVRVLRSAVLASAPSHPFTLTMSAAAAHDPSSLAISRALARSLARVGRKVVLVVAHGSGDTSSLPIAEVGLSHLLQAESGAANQLVRKAMSVEEPGLWVIGPGPRIPSEADLYARADLRGMFHQMQTRADIVILAAPPVPRSEGLALAGAADTVVVTVSTGLTRIDDILVAQDELQRRNARTLGIAVLRRSRHERSLLGRLRRDHLRRGAVPTVPSLVEKKTPATAVAEVVSPHPQQPEAESERAAELLHALDQLESGGIDVIRVSAKQNDSEPGARKGSGEAAVSKTTNGRRVSTS